ncbi:hypothetical protein U3516DRAFT_751592 [Neocallimastix sp. 'constans']
MIKILSDTTVVLWFYDIPNKEKKEKKRKLKLEEKYINYNNIEEEEVEYINNNNNFEEEEEEYISNNNNFEEEEGRIKEKENMLNEKNDVEEIDIGEENNNQYLRRNIDMTIIKVYDTDTDDKIKKT